MGKGGTGEVYEAIDTRLRHRVALKQMLITDPTYARVFEHEAILLADLKHIRLPKVTDHFSNSNGQFLVMEFIPGADLATLLAQQGGPFPVAQVLVWADQLLDLLTYLHNRTPPVLHRDIKPGNLKVAQDGTLMLLDFGLAKGVLTQTHLTSDRSVFGYTEAYAPLEQIQGTGTEVRSDLYAVGATLYHLLMGTLPPNALTRTASLVRRQPDPLRPPHAQNPAIPPAISAALVQALELNPDDRPANATVLRDALRAASPRRSVAPAQVIQQGVSQSPFAVGTPTILQAKPASMPLTVRKSLRKSLIEWIGVSVVILLGVGICSVGRIPAVRRNPAYVPPAMPEMVTVPASSFLMGSSDQQVADVLRQDVNSASWIKAEQPQHTLTLPAYEIGKTEVTNTQFRPFVEGDGYTNQSYWDVAGWQWRIEQQRTQPSCWSEVDLNQVTHPVVCVTWYEAMAYARWLSARTGLNFSLPTEAEWEYAARGTDGQIYPWGNTWKANLVNNGSDTTPVGEYLDGASPYGALDMAGNVWEWTRSIYTPYPYNASDGRETVSDPATKRFTIRGGAWMSELLRLRAANRLSKKPASDFQLIGMRLVRHP